MDEKVLQEAVENISLIKGVIDRTSKSLTTFSRIFIYWGILFLVNSVLSFVILGNREKTINFMTKFPVLSYILPIGIIVILAALVYRHISKKIPLVGLEKHLMKVWMLIVIMNVIPNKVRISSTGSSSVDMTNLVIETNHFSVMIFSLAIALIVTALFTGYNHLMKLGIVYIGISLVYAYLRLPMVDEGLLQGIFSLMLPFTFIYTGFFLKTKQSRGN
ncbi:hypothetical protein [Clostridium paridis]|uniref:Uncharacterized protein n=1 Tax=Clostridium paridis TaxID=2803863 RepID=A0A937FHQ3_9CLOT|nr:hypothetical protein [Clostridium paridis]MBL4931626.1 hypothetical protein [Clostridium paridis]